MWIRKSMMLSALVITTGIYGFGSSDLEGFDEAIREEIQPVRKFLSCIFNNQRTDNQAIWVHFYKDKESNMHINIESTHGDSIEPAE